jgi:hypothetical protein
LSFIIHHEILFTFLVISRDWEGFIQQLAT